ncbi:MAG: hypothetical protein H6537_02410 [Bacteroidales bacterium]|nr:hypothetical protein [Bacteroidales bacterium]HPD94346.1 hypothetical protein [Tenuifilaceae bacterium]HRX30861.1 hypothetical protein [Tenuifilaceae bacterium]
MKKFALLLMAAGMISMVACKSAPKQEEATDETAVEKVDTAAQAETPAADTAAVDSTVNAQ